MFQHTSLLGFNMTPRYKRRVFVSVTYMLLLLVIATVSRLDPFRHETIIWIYLIVMAVSHWLFGRLVRPMFPLKGASPEPGVVHVTPFASKGRPEEDERETSLRADAYVFAYKTILIYSVVLLLGFPLLFSRGAAAGLWGYHGMVLQFMVMLLFVLVFTVPQAAILWRQEDLILPDPRD
jgi:hypothetical protein